VGIRVVHDPGPRMSNVDICVQKMSRQNYLLKKITDGETFSYQGYHICFSYFPNTVSNHRNCCKSYKLWAVFADNIHVSTSAAEKQSRKNTTYNSPTGKLHFLCVYLKNIKRFVSSGANIL
jgi:hypothetical protein